MKDRYRYLFSIFCAIFCLNFCAPAFSAKADHYRPLQLQLTGFEDQAAAEKNAQTELKNSQDKLPFPLHHDDMVQFCKSAPGVVNNAIKPYGYFKANATCHLTKTSSAWLSEIHVNLGPALPVTTVDVQFEGSGSHETFFWAWKKKFLELQGKTLHTKKYETEKSELYSLATEYGYFDAKLVKSEIKINLDAYQAHIVILFNTGARYRFGETTFSTTPFHQKFLMRYLTYKTGDYYDAKQLENMQEDLASSDYFSQAIVKPVFKKAKNNVMPIHVALITRKKAQYSTGLGYGTDTGARAIAGIDIHHMGSSPNRFNANMRASQENSSIVAKYMIPGSNPARDLFTIGTGASNITQSTGTAKNFKFAGIYTMSFGKWKNSISLGYLKERYNIINLPFTSTELVYPTFQSEYVNMDDKLLPTRGVSLAFQLSGAEKQLLSETNFFQITALFKSLYTIKETHTRLLFRTQLGHTVINNLVNLPLSLQLFAGGSRSIRGYSYNSIGPGRNLIVASSEVQQRIWSKLYGVALIDAGVVRNKNLFQHINVGTGPGVAWISSIGVIELTVANAVTQSNRPWAIQFAMEAPI